ncbi:MAG: hypothetical protein R3Y28_01980 [Candidatus Gastranaerophilales bacterium]
MRKKLASSGNGWELYLNTPILKLIGLNTQEKKITLIIKRNILYISKFNSENDTHKALYTKNLVKRGGGYAVFLPQPILELLNINNPEQDFLDIEIDEDKLIIKKA